MIARDVSGRRVAGWGRQEMSADATSRLLLLVAGLTACSHFELAVNVGLPAGSTDAFRINGLVEPCYFDRIEYASVADALAQPPIFTVTDGTSRHELPIEIFCDLPSASMGAVEELLIVGSDGLPTLLFDGGYCTDGNETHGRAAPPQPMAGPWCFPID